MRNFKLTIEYDGGRYDGWQRLGKDESTNTIENKITEVLEKMSGMEITLFGGMRTEKGVHAYGQTASFKCDTQMSCKEILHYLNRYLPRDIAVTDVREMPERFHAALNAKSKTFIYRIDVNEVPDVFERKYKYNAFKRPDVERMEEALGYLKGEHDFKKFSSVKKNKSTVKTVFDAGVIDDGTEIQLSIKANDFLHNMARLIFGTILAVGSSELEPEVIKTYLDVNSVEAPEKIADTCGLFLQEIEY
ncbi:MAG: tRNA pseudouridine(38-40) synthase TruA [Thermoflexaceae bacterium]|nr:tRNA pseudouridine(38-40) synthase TruA [Thermoflexaceae bacterium]